MHIDELIYKLEELRSKYEDLCVYVWDNDEWEKEFSVEIVERVRPNLKVINLPEGRWVGIR